MKKLALTIIISLMMATPLSSQVSSENIDLPFGMHPASTDYGKQTAKSFEQATLMQVGWNRPPLYAFQFLIQKDIKKPVYDFVLHDNLYGQVPTNLKILANITPDITNEKEHGYFLSKTSYIPKDIDSYTKFVKAVVERYDGDGTDDMPGLKNPIKHWQVDNEPPKNRQGYAKLLEITYRAIKEADPDCKVLIGGATGFPGILDKNFKHDFIPMFKELGGKYFDIFDYHWYGSLKEYSGCQTSCKLIRQTLDEYGFKDVPIWITEMGSYSGKPSGFMDRSFDYQSESDMADDIFRKLLHPLSYGVSKVFPAFGMIEGFMDVNDNNYFNNTGFIYDGIGKYDKGRGVRKLAFWTYKLISDNFGRAELSKTLTLKDSDNIKVIKFEVDGKPVYACWFDWWNDKSDTAKISLDVGKGTWEIIEAISGKDSGKDIKPEDYPTCFKCISLTTTNGTINLTVGKKPLIIK